jgi:hypothetical protein
MALRHKFGVDPTDFPMILNLRDLGDVAVSGVIG